MRRRSLTPLLACAVALVTACADTGSPTAPVLDAPVACQPVDCPVSNSEPATLRTPLAEVTRVAAGSLQDAEFGQRIGQSVQHIADALDAGKSDVARTALGATFAELDAALSNGARASDWPDLAAIRLNLTPLGNKLGVVDKAP